MKREAGESPARTRRCKRGAFLPFHLQMHQGISAGKRKSLGNPGTTKKSVDTQVRRPACSGYEETTWIWLVRRMNEENLRLSFVL